MSNMEIDNKKNVQRDLLLVKSLSKKVKCRVLFTCHGASCIQCFSMIRWHSLYKTWMFKNTLEPKDCMAKDNKVIQKFSLLLVMLVILICLFLDYE
jgi:hypothetical protein